jgi:hypothetical protein
MMVMRDRSVVVSLREPVVGVKARRGGVVIVAMRSVGSMVMPVRMLRCGIVVMRVSDVRRKPHLMRMHRHETRVNGRAIVYVLNIDLKMVTVIEYGAGKGGRRVLDLEDVFQAIQDDDRHLDGQRHAQPHAEQGDVPLGDCKPLADHDSSRSPVWNH